MIIPLSIAFAICLASIALGFVIARNKYLADAKEVLKEVKKAEQGRFDYFRNQYQQTTTNAIQSAYAVGYKDGQNGSPFLGKVSN